MMRTFPFAFWLIVALQATAVLAQSIDQRAIDPAKSRAQFSIQHIFVEHVTGTIPIQNGTVDLPAGAVIPIRATAVLDATKFNTGDPDRDGSLTSPDYFDTKTFPTWTFTSTKITSSGPASFSMDGTLTMHGVTQPEHLDATVRGDAAHPVYHLIGHIDRRTWGMKGTRLDPVIGNVADVTLDVVLK